MNHQSSIERLKSKKNENAGKKSKRVVIDEVVDEIEQDEEPVISISKKGRARKTKKSCSSSVVSNA